MAFLQSGLPRKETAPYLDSWTYIPGNDDTLPAEQGLMIGIDYLLALGPTNSFDASLGGMAGWAPA